MSPAPEATPSRRNRWIRRAHRWVSVAFTVAVVVNIVGMGLDAQAVWLGLLALPPLALLLVTGIYLFALPYASRWRRVESARAGG